MLNGQNEYLDRYSFAGDEVLATATLDRLPHRCCDVLNMWLELPPPRSRAGCRRNGDAQLRATHTEKEAREVGKSTITLGDRAGATLSPAPL